MLPHVHLELDDHSDFDEGNHHLSLPVVARRLDSCKGTPCYIVKEEEPQEGLEALLSPLDRKVPLDHGRPASPEVIPLQRLLHKVLLL